MSFTTDQTRLIVGWLDNHPEILSDAISWHIDSTTRPAPTVSILASGRQQLPEGAAWSPAWSFVSDIDGRKVTYREAVLHDSKDFRVIMRGFRTISAFDPLKPAEEASS
ncbi:hypothetical protein DUY81_13880 [Acidipropionibacterium acidipropionici]|uniref:Uncharacterized protein n=1 Tax=Acidipropionibacterium acidipropionici TaxID=1748 RepID=A0AAC8YGX7_9ACTN|nr:hypothetical protein [Acidipropionibacterium acidipropionici]AMS06481.1 hypothetical protein AXH35_14485 [Acidipropionibacterium acidipropionici]AOZ47928.1 hypothetical protein A8L58_15940 [Acidipropionibacterium acidipropionici]AZP38726.1 hypothetical protein DUY81_13880 [Acidipropionibacterium acidipropionici]